MSANKKEERMKNEVVDIKNKYSELSQRKKDLLFLLIKTYLDTGEPVGSRTVSKLDNVDFSPATIRNEMADLEELGYIYSPHTSSGRIPTDLGYRFYVDNLLINQDKKINKMNEMFVERFDKMEEALKNTAKLLASNTNYATIISSPKNNTNRIKFIQLSKIEKNQILIVIVSQGNIVRNKVIKVKKSVDDKTMLKLNMYLNTALAGIRLEEINLGMFASIKAQIGDDKGIVEEVIKSVIESIKLEDLEVYTSGTTNILKYPELSDNNMARELLAALEDKTRINSIINKGDDDLGIKVYIGEENQSENMKDCAVVTANYNFSDELKGKIGIVGPKRMDYDKVVTALRSVIENLDETYKEKGDEGIAKGKKK